MGGDATSLSAGTTDGMQPAGGTGQEVLAVRLSELARTLQHQQDLTQTLEGIVHAAVETVPGAEQASISAVERRQEVQTLAATSELSRAVDRAQYETEQGPCLSTLYDRVTERLPDLAADERWPAFSSRAAALGVGSMLSVRLFVEGDELGALNLLSRSPGAFGDESEHVALLFASHAAVALVGAGERARLQEAMSSRDLIGQAKGILMERFKITSDQAFLLLVRTSQDSNRKLRVVAEELASTGQLPRG